MKIFSTTAQIILTIFVTFLTLIIIGFKWRYRYWKRRNFPQLEPRIPYGNTKGAMKEKIYMAFRWKELYDEIRSKGLKHAGCYFLVSPIYLVADLDYVRNIFTKDFQYFTDRGSYYNEKVDPLSAHLFSLGGVKWRNLRTKLTPTFTSGRLKAMFQTLVDCESYLQQRIKSDVDQKKPIDIKEVLCCFTTDIIGTCAFGLDCKSIQEDNSPFRYYGKKVLERSPLRILKTLLAMNIPFIAKLLGVISVPRNVDTFFRQVVNDTVSYREQNAINRKDFLQLLIDLKNNNLEQQEEELQYDGKTLTIDEIAAQCFVFFVAGFETSATTMTFALYELAKNQDLQDKLRKEISQVLAKHEGKISYDAMQELKYMEQVISETLRMYPPTPHLTRKCVKDYKIPDENLVIEKGTAIFIPVYAIHHDKEYFPDPEKFDPERFNEENKESRHQYAYIPFGGGPRLCIGSRFAIMQTKVGLTSLLQSYRFTVNSKTQEPLELKANAAIPMVQGGVWLDAQKI